MLHTIVHIWNPNVTVPKFVSCKFVTFKFGCNSVRKKIKFKFEILDLWINSSWPSSSFLFFLQPSNEPSQPSSVQPVNYSPSSTFWLARDRRLSPNAETRHASTPRSATQATNPTPPLDKPHQMSSPSQTHLAPPGDVLLQTLAALPPKFSTVVSSPSSSSPARFNPTGVLSSRCRSVWCGRCRGGRACRVKFSAINFVVVACRLR